MRLPIPATLIARDSGRKVSASVQLTAERDLLEWTNWKYLSTDADRDWDWWDFFQQTKPPEGQRECYALVAESAVQGLMLLKPDGTGPRQSVVVEYLATNPANRSPKAGFKRVGAALLAVAVMRSLAGGMGGRLWLESLPDAEQFYLSLGFAVQTKKSPDGFAVFTLSESAAEDLLEEIKRKGILEA